jgi:hypothetical protein
VTRLYVVKLVSLGMSEPFFWRGVFFFWMVIAAFRKPHNPVLYEDSTLGSDLQSKFCLFVGSADNCAAEQPL